jgi:hypothetical protein
MLNESRILRDFGTRVKRGTVIPGRSACEKVAVPRHLGFIGRTQLVGKLADEGRQASAVQFVPNGSRDERTHIVIV